jgi:hypothetical protein
MFTVAAGGTDHGSQGLETAQPEVLEFANAAAAAAR